MIISELVTISKKKIYQIYHIQQNILCDPSFIRPISCLNEAKSNMALVCRDVSTPTIAAKIVKIGTSPEIFSGSVVMKHSGTIEFNIFKNNHQVSSK